MSGHVFIFRGRSGNQIKLLWCTGDGLCLLTKRLELMRSAFRVIRTVREKHACTQCDAIVQARLLTSKYTEHTPLYRQSEIIAARVWN